MGREKRQRALVLTDSTQLRKDEIDKKCLLSFDYLCQTIQS